MRSDFKNNLVQGSLLTYKVIINYQKMVFNDEN